MLSLSYRRSRGRSQSLWWIIGVCCLCVMSVSYSSNASYCGPPCTPEMCRNTSRTCGYGTYEVCGGCCYECLAGPGGLCEANEPECGHRLHCVGASTNGPPIVHMPGRCEWRINSTNSTPSVEPIGKCSLYLVLCMRSCVCVCGSVCAKQYSCIVYNEGYARRPA